MRHPLEDKIKALLWKNESKEKIYHMLATDSNRVELQHLLNNLPSGNSRKKTFPITLLLVLLLGLLTVKQCLFVYLYGRFDVFSVLTLVGPIIHLFVMRELLLSHRLGYQLLPLLSILALFRPENQIVPDLYMYLCMAVLSAVLYLILFPKNARLQKQPSF